MSFECMAWAIKKKTGSVSAKAVLMHLANCTNHQSGVCRPRIKLIADECEISESTVKTALKKLEELGVIRVIPRFKEGIQLSNDYQLNLGGVGQNLTQGGLESDPGVGQNLTPVETGRLKQEEETTTLRGGFKNHLPEQQPQSAGDSPDLKGLVPSSEEKSKGGRKQKEVPAPPTQEELTTYMQETWPWLPKIESELCHARHTTSGWVDKNNKPFKDWRGAAKTWATNWKKWNPALYVEALRKLQTERRSETNRDTGAGW